MTDRQSLTWNTFLAILLINIIYANIAVLKSRYRWSLW